MLNPTTPNIGLPLPSAANKLEEDLPRLITALGILDTQLGAIHALLGSDDTTLDQVQELVNAIKDNRTTIAALLADMATKEQLAAVSAAVTAVGAASATVLDLQNLSAHVAATAPGAGLAATPDANGNLPGTLAFRLPLGAQGQFYLLEPYGLYMFQGSATDPADGQTCILPVSGAGRWMLICPTWDFSYTWLQLDFDAAKCLSATASLDFPSMTSAGTSTLTINVAGAQVGEPVIVVAPSTFPGQVQLYGSVTQPGIVSVVATNAYPATIDPAAASITAIIFRN